MGQLEVVANGRRYVFDTGTTVICGRSAQAQVPLTDRRVGRVHARLAYETGAWYLVDADSTNGTWINGERVNRQRIEHEITAHLGNPKDGALLFVRPYQLVEPRRDVVDRTMPMLPTGEFPQVEAAPAAGLTPDAAAPGSGRAPGAGPPGAGSLAHAQPPGAPPGPAVQPQPPAPVGQLPAAGGLPAAGRPPVQEGTLVGGSTFDSAPVLVVRLGTRTLVFPVGQPVRVGRDPELEAVTDHPLVSRNYHGLLTTDYGGATYTDSSSRGTYANGRRLKASLRITEPVTLRLGDPATGEELGVTPPLSLQRLQVNQRRRVRGTRLRVLAGVVAALILLGGATAAAIILTRHPAGKQITSTALATVTLHHAESATVRLLQGTPDSFTGSGSGTIISSNGLILTNAHVAAPQTPGQAVAFATPGGSLEANPEFLTVEFTTGDASAAVPRYRAHVVAVDGYLDLAVVAIFATSTGQPVDPTRLSLPFLKLGDVSKLGLDQNVTILGFPGVSGSDSITVTSGGISTFIPDPLGHVKDPRYQIETTARVAHGNSGGAAVNNAGELIGVPSLTIPGQGSDLSWRLRSVAPAAPLIAAARGGTAYTSNVLVPLGGQMAVTLSGVGATIDVACGGNQAVPGGTDHAEFAFGYTGAPAGVDVAFQIRLPNGTVVITEALQAQSVPGLPEATLTNPSGCIGFNVTANSLGASTIPDGGYQAQLLGGPNLDPLAPAVILRVGA